MYKVVNFNFFFFQNFQLSPIERYAMRFVEETEGTWTAVQLKAVELEIENQKREWEANRLAALKKEEEEKRRMELEENENMITYARDDALNKVNNNTDSNSKKSLVSTRNSSKAGRKSDSPKSRERNNGAVSRRSQQSQGVVESNGNRSNKKLRDSKVFVRQTRRNLERRRAKSTRSNSSSVQSRATTTDKTTSHNSDDSEDSECSMDVMIDSNDVNDSDSNSNQNGGKHGSISRHVSNSNFDSSQDEETLMNDDTPTVINKHLNNTIQSDLNSSPRTRSRGSVKIDLWTLDDSPILPPFKRAKAGQNRSGNDSTAKSDLDSSQELVEDSKPDFGIKELKVVIDHESNCSTVSPKVVKSGFGSANKSKASASPRNTRKRALDVTSSNNSTLDNWLQKIPKTTSSPNLTAQPKTDPLKPESPTRIMTRRSTMREH